MRSSRDPTLEAWPGSPIDRHGPFHAPAEARSPSIDGTPTGRGRDADGTAGCSISDGQARHPNRLRSAKRWRSTLHERSARAGTERAEDVGRCGRAHRGGIDRRPSIETLFTGSGASCSTSPIPSSEGD
jgi:hypothetical protein